MKLGGYSPCLSAATSDQKLNAREGGEQSPLLTGWGLEDSDFTLFETSVQGPHKLELNVIRRIRVMEILSLGLHDGDGGFFLSDRRRGS